MYLSEDYYSNMYNELLQTLNEDSEFIDDIMRNIVFEEIENSDKLKTSDRIYLYKENVLCFMNEGKIQTLWKYGHKDVKDVGKDIRKIGSKAYDTITEPIRSYRGARDIFVQTAQNVNDRLNNTDTLITSVKSKLEAASDKISELMNNKKLRIVGGIIVAMFIALVVKMLYNVIKTHMQGSCAKLKGRENILCRVKILDEYKKMVEKQKIHCNKTKDPTECSNKLDRVLEKISKEQQKLLKKIR